jgi:hypothetical protein
MTVAHRTGHFPEAPLIVHPADLLKVPDSSDSLKTYVCTLSSINRRHGRQRYRREERVDSKEPHL